LVLGLCKREIKHMPFKRGGRSGGQITEKLASVALAGSGVSKDVAVTRDLIATGRILPARLTFTAHPDSDKLNPAGHVWDISVSSGVEISIELRYVTGNYSGRTQLSQKLILDCKMYTDWWVNASEVHDVKLVRLAKLSYRKSACLIIWRYGKGIPATGAKRNTNGGHPIYQRIGLLNTDEE
jgi:hypothetical protein